MPLLQLIDNSTLVQREQTALQQTQDNLLQEQLLTSLAGHIQRQWQINRDHKSTVEEVLLDCLRQRNGEYSARELGEIREMGGSEVYMMLTAAKVRACASWISDIMLPAGDKAWSIEATPVPDLPPQMRDMTIRLLTEEVTQAQAQGVNPNAQQIEERTLEFKQRMLQALQRQADKAAELMEVKIEDQLTESGFDTAMEEFIDDFSTFPAAFVKGPVYRRRKGLRWGQNGEPEIYDEVYETDVRVSPFNIFPSPGAVCIQDGNLIELIRYSKMDLSDMIGLPGYDDNAIQMVLEDYQGGYLGDWTSQHTHELDRLQDDLIDALHYWGSASGKDLLEWGMDRSMIESPWKQYQIEAILIGRHLILVRQNQDILNRRPYYKASFQNKPGSFWGISPPMLMEDLQRMWVHTDMLPQGEVITGMHPWKVFQTISKNQTANVDPIKFFQPNSNAAELLEVYNTFEAKADDATNIPRYMYGNEKVAGAGQTAQGLAMLLESASKGIKAAVRHIDSGVIKPRIERQYQYNMLYLQDQSIKGDLKVVARGSSALIAKAASQARRNEFLAITNNETDAMILGVEGRTDILREMAKDMDMPNVVPDDAEIQRRIAQMQEPQQQEADPRVQIEQMRLEWEQAKMKATLEDNERERQIKELLARYGLQGDMMELAGKKELTLEQIKAKLGETAMRERGANDRFVAEKQIKAQFGSGI